MKRRRGIAEIKATISSPVMKAIRVATAPDLEVVPDYEAVADMLLFDAKPPPNVTALPGGNGVPFDWTILAGRTWTVPWMLSGGLTIDNLAEIGPHDRGHRGGCGVRRGGSAGAQGPGAGHRIPGARRFDDPVRRAAE